jgi:hypothetical protein
MKLPILLAVGIGAFCNLALADCYTRTNIHLTRDIINAGPTDVQQLVVPDPAGSKCIMRYRVHIGNDWRTAEGSGVGKTAPDACKLALDISRGRVLAEVEPTRVTSDMSLVCSDLPDIQVRSVRIGEVIWESETDMHRVPEERKYFTYKATQCRMFTERNSKDRNFYTYQGIICRVNSLPNSKWQVVDKY